VVVTIHGLHPRHAEAVRFPGHAGQLRQGERRDPADHRLLAPLAEALAIIGVPQGFVAALTSMSEPYMLILLMILILIAAGCVMETTPNIVILAPILKPLATISA
jgi:acyl-CoA reductase-like NAD-dependent aldehyde dehydrogenase